MIDVSFNVSEKSRALLSMPALPRAGDLICFDDGITVRVLTGCAIWKINSFSKTWFAEILVENIDQNKKDDPK